MEYIGQVLRIFDNGFADASHIQEFRKRHEYQIFRTPLLFLLHETQSTF